jgi:hypothetical protein
MAQELKEYIKTLVNKGKSPEDIRQILLASGWKAKDVEGAVKEAYLSGLGDDVPPPPAPQERHSMVQISINFFSFILLWTVAFSAGTLFFEVINKYFPDILLQGNYGYSNNSPIYTAMASVIVALPLYLWTMWFWFRSFARNQEQQESRLSKWFTYIILLAAAGTIVGDLIGTITKFLQGEVTMRFSLKALTLFVIAGTVFVFYFFERRRVQYKKMVPATTFKIISAFSIVVAILGLSLGFAAAGSPREARLMGLDNQRVQSLEQISSAVGGFASTNKRLPQSLAELNKSVAYYVPSITDPESGQEYGYRIVSENEFELCATFATSNLGASNESMPSSVWSKHDVGEMCKTQTVTFYPEYIPSPQNIPSPLKI